LILRERLLEKQVLPSAEQQHRYLRAFERLMQLQRRPMWIVVLGMLEPGLEPWCARAQ